MPGSIAPRTHPAYGALVPRRGGVAWSGGYPPAAAFAITAAFGNVCKGPRYLAAFAVVSFIVCSFFLREIGNVDILHASR